MSDDMMERPTLWCQVCGEWEGSCVCVLPCWSTINFRCTCGSARFTRRGESDVCQRCGTRWTGDGK